MSSKPRHGEPIAETDSGQNVRFTRQMQSFIDEMELQIRKLTDRIKALEDENTQP